MTIDTVIVKDESAAQLVELARRTAEQLVRAGLTRSQMRTVFSEIRQIEALWQVEPDKARRRLGLLKPKMAYQTNRHKALKALADLIGKAIDLVLNAESPAERERRFRHLVDFVEAVLAYHRASGGKN